MLLQLDQFFRTGNFCCQKAILKYVLQKHILKTEDNKSKKERLSVADYESAIGYFDYPGDVFLVV